MRKKFTASRMHAHHNNFASISTGFSDFTDFILRSDPFKVSATAGPRLALGFYAVFISAIFCVMLAITLTIIPGQAEEDLLKSQILTSHSNWLYARKKQQLSATSVQLSITPSTKSHHHNNILMQLKDSSADSFAANTNNNHIYSIPSTTFTLASSHFEQSIAISQIVFDREYFLNLRVNNANNGDDAPDFKELGNLPSSQGIPVQFAGRITLEYTQMAKMGLCPQDACADICTSHKGVNGQPSSSHSLDKHVQRDIQSTCTSDFVAKQICIVATEDEAGISSYQGSCYDSPAIYAFANESKNSDIQVVLRVQGDPYLKALEVSSNYSPIELQQTHKERKAEMFYCVGAGLLLFLIACIVIIRVQEERNLKQQFTEIHHISTIKGSVYVSSM